MVKIKSFKQDKHNFNKGTESGAKLMDKSLKELGAGRSILVDKDDNIIAGNKTALAAINAGIEDAIVVETTGDKLVVVKRTDIDIDSKEGRELAYVDNKANEINLEWDDEEILTTADTFGVDFTEWDAEASDLNEIDEVPSKPKEVTEDDFDEDKDKIITRVSPGDLWQLGDHRLKCGDSTQEADIQQLMGGGTASLCLTDPPYGIDVVNNDGKVGNGDFGVRPRGVYSKVIADDTTDTAKAAYERIKECSQKHILWGGNYFTDFLPFSDGWIIWDKRCDSGIRNSFADGEMAWCSFHTPVRIYHQLWNGMIREGEHDKRVHPTQKPIRMLSEVLQDYSKSGDIVLDVFGGSGSTLIACEQLGRKCRMMELDPHYCDVIIARWEKLTGKEAKIIK